MTPPRGFGNQLSELHRWLNEAAGPQNFAIHQAPCSGADAIGVHVRTLDVAADLLRAFPDLVLADRI
ncbi:hypothetical protein [Octadecabacter antarcticus]|uniref:hypothetical protein n=1 Tax=Octadecabacter antarcticus TaxID=1217908 RepID=UPI0001806D4A|nr:hypothetical protein [Octadecabacter antarcticus]